MATKHAGKIGAVKICGLQDVHNALVATDAGADLLGFVLAPSRRQVRTTLVIQVREYLKHTPDAPRLVTVVANESNDELRKIVDLARPDAIQLSGDEDVNVLDSIEVAVLRSLRMPDGLTYDEARVMIDPWCDHDRPVETVLVEAYVEGKFGGAGKVTNWELAARLAETYPIILAGGLSPTNVGNGIAQVRPVGVDVSSGVESGGLKDPARIRSFIENAREAFDGIGPNATP